MANGRYDNDGWDGGKSLSGSASKDPNKVDVGKLTDMIIADGRFLGMPMPKEMLDEIHKYLPILLIYGATGAQKWASEQSWGGPGVGKAVGISVALIDQIASTIQNLYFLTTSLSNLHATMKPAAKAAGKSSALTMDNEAIQDLRGKILSAFTTRMIDTIISSTGSIFAIAEVMKKVDVIDRSIEKTKALQATGGDPKKIADVLEAEAYGVGAAALTAENKALTSEQMQKAYEEVALRQQQRFNEGFSKFKAEESGKLAENLLEEVKSLTKENWEIHIGRLKNNGLDVSSLENSINELKKAELRQSLPNGKALTSSVDSTKPFNLEDEIGLKIEKWKPLFTNDKSPYLKSVVEETLKKQYAVDHGTFNREQVIKSLTEQNKAREQLQKEVSATKEKTDVEKSLPHIITVAKGWFSGLARNFLVGLVGGTALEKLKKPLAAERIAHLDKILTHPKNDPDWKPPERVPSMEDRAKKQSGDSRNNREGLTDTMGYTQFIHEIIQTHQNTRGRAEVGERFFQHFENAEWRDNKIQEMKDSELTPYEYALKHVTKRILDGKLAVSSLLELVGNKRGNKIVQSDGRTFGPAGSGADDASAKAAILKLIDDYSMSINTSKELTPEELSKKKGQLLFSEKDLKEKLEAKDTDPEYRAFIFRLYSDAIGSEPTVCKELGINAERCGQLRKECADFNFMMDGVLGTLEQKLQELQDDPKALEAFLEILKLTPAERELITSLNERKRKEGGNVPDLTKKPEDTEALYALAFNSVMLLEKNPSVQFDVNGTPMSFWESVKQQIDELKNPKEVTQHNDHEDQRMHAKRNPRREGDHAERESFSHREKLEKPNHDKGHHEKKWATDKHHDDDGFSGRVRRNKMESESEPARGGLL